MKPPLSDFLLAEVNTERLLNVSVFLRSRASARRARDLGIASCSQHRSLAYDNLEESDGDLADIRVTRKDFVGATAEVAILDSAAVSSRLAPAQGPTRKREHLHVVHLRQPYAKLTAGTPGGLWRVRHTDHELDVSGKRAV